MKGKYLYFFCLILIGSMLRGDDPRTVMVFPDANSRPTYFTIHYIHQAQKLSRGKGCKVGILDHSFGMDLHPDLYAGGKNFVKDDETFLTHREWHGYWMAVALHEVAPEADIYALNIVSFIDRDAMADAVSRAVDWAIEQEIDVLTYSQAGVKAEFKPIFNQALDRASQAGIITTFIHTGHSGNIMPTGLWSGQDDGREPDINVFHYDYTVIPIDEYQKLKNGEKTWWNPPFLSVSSTSPVLGGIVAMMKSLSPEMTSEQCRKILIETSFPMEFEGEYAPRVMDAYSAVKKVLQLQYPQVQERKNVKENPASLKDPQINASIPIDITIDRDGILLKGKFYMSDGNGPFPTVILLHGFIGNDADILGIGSRLSEIGVNVLTFNYSGTHKSEGKFNFENTQKDIQAAFEFIHQPRNIHEFKIDTARIYLGGYSYGGGMALTYAADHPEINAVFSIGGNDHGIFMEEYSRNPEMKKMIDKMFNDLKSQPEKVRFAPGGTPEEIAEINFITSNPTYHLLNSASLLAQKDILLIGGWDDQNVSVEKIVLPLYRALIKEKAKNVKISAVQDDHSFRHSREELAQIIIKWIKTIPEDENRAHRIL